MKKGYVILTFVFLLMTVLFHSVSAQEKVVCLVYFTSHECGDDCGLTDTFMDGLLNEYMGNLTSIKYHVDVSQESRSVFEAYRRAYDLPESVPIVLFGKDDYFQGINDIYQNTEARILEFMNTNGTNCPLEIGYVPSSQLRPSEMPGQPEVRQGGPENNTGDGSRGDGQKPQDNVNGTANGEALFLFVLLGEAETESILSLVMILVAAVFVGVLIFFAWMKEHEKKE